MPVVKIPNSLRSFTANRAQLAAEGVTLGDILTDLDRQCPGLRNRLLDDKGELRRFLNIYVGDEDVRRLQGLKTPIRPNDELLIIQAFAGG